MVRTKARSVVDQQKPARKAGSAGKRQPAARGAPGDTPPARRTGAIRGEGSGTKPQMWAAQIRSVAGQVLEWAGTAAEVAVVMTKPLIKDPASRKAVAAAGRFLRDARETAGFSTDELARAIRLDDQKILELAESGKIAIPFEIILRIASLLARNDPIPFVMALSRGYAPGVWKAIEQVGVGRLLLQTAREHEFINIYRSRDSLRALSDREFAQLLGFVASAVDTTIGLVDGLKKDGK